MRPVASSCGVKVQPDARPGDPRAFDYVVVVGGLIDEVDKRDSGTARFLHAAAGAGVPLVGVCTGAFALHRAGLMDGYRCCVSWFHHADFLEQFAGLVPVSDRIWSPGSGICTAGSNGERTAPSRLVGASSRKAMAPDGRWRSRPSRTRSSRKPRWRC